MAKKALAAQHDEILKDIEKELERLGKYIGKPMPLKMRIPAILAGAILISFGVTIIVFFLTHGGVIFAGNRYHSYITFWDYIGTMGGSLICFLGYLVSHKAIQGVWI